MVGHDPVDLLGHRSIEGPKTSLDVGHREVELRGGEGPGEGRVRVAVHKDTSGFDRTSAFSRPASIRPVWAPCAPDPIPRLTVGLGMRRDRKNASLIAAS